jgi:2-polyprenyl-3-methyl-5-hydroxy-6-metoxy-1,4-benzoquinol methylase
MGRNNHPNQKVYDVYLKNPHPIWMKKIFKRYHRNIALYIISLFSDQKIRLLEVGPGRGYFYESILKNGKNIEYTAIDRNKSIIKNLNISRGYVSDALDMPVFPQKFDVIYAAYIIEHLQNGLDLYKFFHKCLANLNPGGQLIILTNNALAQRMEFWHVDYTHSYPTTPRNVAMALYDSGFQNVRIRDITDFSIWLTANIQAWPLVSKISRILLLWYNQNIFRDIYSLFHKNDIYILSDKFFQFHIFTQHQNMFITASK